MPKPIYKRILLKLSGEALMGRFDYGIDPEFIRRLAREISELRKLDVEVAVVIGGGNIFRGAGLAEAGMDRVTGDHMGMLSTVINSLAFQDSLERENVFTRVMSAVSIHRVCEDYIQRRAIRHLEKGRTVIFAAGTGNPFFTTDSAASLRAIEVNADVLIKSTKVDGVYSADPKTAQDAVRFDRLDYDDVINHKLEVMDATSVVLCRDNSIPIQIFDGSEEGALLRLVMGEQVGTLISNGR